MQPNKKIFKKNHFFRWIVFGAILLVVIFQGYSLISYYNNLSNIFIGMLNHEFEEAVMQYRTTTFKQSKLKFRVEYDTEKSFYKTKNYKKSKIKTINKYKGLPIDEILKKLPGFSLSTLPIYMDRLDSIYKAKLQQRKLLVDYKIVAYQTENDSILKTSKSNFNIKGKSHTPRYELDVKRTAQVYFKNPALFIIKKMAVLLALSAVVLVIIVVLLVYQMRIIAKQKQIEKVRRDFTDSMTHELRNPLQGAIALSEVLSDSIFVADVKRRTNAIDRIKNNLQRIKSLLDSIMERSYAEDLQLTIKREQGDLPETIQQLIADFKLLTDKKVMFETHFDTATVPYQYDLLHFPNVIKNLIDNAIKYSEEEVTIKVTLTHSDNHFTVTVADNGIGIKEEDLPKVFDKFFRVRDKGAKYGFGLGLSYVKWVTELHSGTVSVASKFGKGTTFTVTIPFIIEDSEVC